MKKTIISIIIFLNISILFAQNIQQFKLKDAKNNEPLIGANALLKSINIGASSDIDGLLTLKNIPNGKQIIVFSYTGYEKMEKTIEFPTNTPIIEIQLTASEGELEELIIEGTRSNRSIENIPTRVEALTEEIDEASTMDPSKVAHLLTHSTGIQVQQTSATSNTANVRMQGLDGRYTQILKDGFPIYGGFSGSLSIMQIPPLDLRQVEYIKGGASTLYGGGAIAGLINLLSKEPNKEETLIHFNASQLGAVDVNTFVSRKFDKAGFTLLAQRNTHRAFDADSDGFTDLPQLTKYNFNPRLFYQFNEKTKGYIGATFTNETKNGGDMKILEGELPTATNFYSEKNDIARNTSQIKLEHQLSDNQHIEFRNSFNFFNRALNITPSFGLGRQRFAGDQVSSFSEMAYIHRKEKNVLITGLNYYSDDFKERALQGAKARIENYKTLGAFANYVFDLGKKVSIESGLRSDYVFDEKVYILPRVSALLKWTEKMTTRIGGGMGYRNASIFNQEAEILAYQNVLAINRSSTKGEQSLGGNVDFGYKTPLGDNFFLSFNQMFFYSKVDKPLILKSVGNNYEFVNANGYTTSRGAETFFKFGFYDFVWFVGYTYTDANNHFDNKHSVLTLTPKHSIKGDVLYALPGKWRIGVDYEYKSPQTLSNGNVTRGFWSSGGLVEYTHNNLTFYVNTENFGNVRQTDFESLRSAPYNTPQFTEIYAPLDGFVINAGMKVRL